MPSASRASKRSALDWLTAGGDCAPSWQTSTVKKSAARVKDATEAAHTRPPSGKNVTLVFQTQRELYDPRLQAALCVVHLESQVLQATDCIGWHVVRMIEGIEEVGGKANVQPLLCFEVFVD